MWSCCGMRPCRCSPHRQRAAVRASMGAGEVLQPATFAKGSRINCKPASGFDPSGTPVGPRLAGIPLAPTLASVRWALCLYTVGARSAPYQPLGGKLQC